jgi:hypothetical protein
MNYHIERNGEPLGIYAEEDIPEALFSGDLKLSDLVWCEGMEGWEPVSELVEIEELPQHVRPSGPRRPPSFVKGAPVAFSPLPKSAPLPPPPSVFAAPKSESSGYAIVSLALGISSLCAGLVTGLPAIIFGIIALKKIKGSGGRQGGRGLAFGGMAAGLVLGLFGTALLASLLVPAYEAVQVRARLLQSASHARQIMMAMKSYASDNGGLYPDADPRVNPANSNQAFRELFKRRYLEDERVFATPSGEGHPDNDIGAVPDFSEALERGENGWAMSKGMSAAAPGGAPLIFEAPALAVWPPRWRVVSVSDPGDNERPLGKVVVGRNDGSVASESLQRPRAFEPVSLLPSADGSSLFDLVPSKEMLLPDR